MNYIIKTAKNLLLIFAAIAFVVTPCYLSGYKVMATEYEGDGTKSSPYIVKSAEQLDGMRNNLKACYKLSANIDLSGYKCADPTPKQNFNGAWVPIGTYSESKSFTGSLTCDLDSNGNPLYEITNLTVRNLAGEIYGHTLNKYKSYTDAKDGECYWEAGLFGTTRNASITNIKVTGAKIRNTVLGQNQMTNEGTSAIVPCSNQMGTGILVSKAYGSKISGCIISGEIESASNGIGGIVGTASKTVISNCDVNANINGTGLWCCGGFVGIAEDCGNNAITNCHFSGNVNTISSSPGLFATSSNTTYRNCFAEGSINNGDTFVSTKQPEKYIFNCYSLGKRTDGKSRGAATKFNNSFVVTGGYSENIAMATLDEIKTTFSTLSGWDCSGDHPVLSKKAALSTSQSGTSGSKGTITGSNGATEENQIDGQDVDGSGAGDSVVYVNGLDIMTCLSDLPDAYSIELDDAKKYLNIYWAYTVMPEDLKSQLSEEQVTNINEIGKVVSKHVLADIKKRIEKLPDVKKMSSKNATELSDISDMYQLMLPEYKADLNPTLYKKLCDGLEKLGLSGVLVNSPSSLNSMTKWVLILCIILNVLLVSGIVFIIVYSIRRVKKMQKIFSDNKTEISDNESIGVD